MRLFALSPARIRFISVLLLPLAYYMTFGRYGFAEMEQGYLQAVAWRIFQGEVPYFDFFYPRLPLSPWLHSFVLWLPDTWEMTAERLLFYMLMGGIVFWLTRTFTYFFDFKPIGLSPELFAAMAFVLSVHNHPAMASPVVDGLFFASWGINRLVRGKHFPAHWVGLVLLVLAAACAKRFFPLPLLGLALLGIQHGRDAVGRAGLGTLALLLLTFALLVSLAPDWPGYFWRQVHGQADWSLIWQAGFWRFGWPLLVIVLPLLLVWQALSVYKYRFLPGGTFLLVFLGLLLAHVLQAFVTKTYIPPGLGFFEAFWLIAVGICAKGYWVNPRAYGALLALLLLSWCAGLGDSPDFDGSMLGFTPVLFAFLYGLYDELDFVVPRYFYGSVLALLLWIFATLQQYPYANPPREVLTIPGSEVVPRLTGVYVSPSFAQRTRELQRLQGDSLGPMVAGPAFPAAHYLLNQRNPLPADRFLNADLRYKRHPQRWHDTLTSYPDLVFWVEKAHLYLAQDSSARGSLLTGYVLENGTEVRETPHFLGYRLGTESTE